MFRFKQFTINDSHTPMKVGTDGVLLGAWADPSGASLIIDAGTGSGLIALMMAQRVPGARVKGIEISPDAAADAAANVAASPWPDRVEIISGDCLDYTLPAEERILIVSNPPFFAEQLRSPDTGRALARHGGAFDVISLIDWAALHPEPNLAFIAPTSRDDEIDFQLALRRLVANRICRVTTRDGRPPQRTLWQVSRHGSTIESSLIVRDRENRFTEEYIRLTSPFYLDR